MGEQKSRSTTATGTEYKKPLEHYLSETENWVGS
jgi:hypothetical protein